MLRVERRAIFYRPPDASVLTDDRRRFAKPIVANGTNDEPDTFDLRERCPEEFASDDTPQAAGKRAKKIEGGLAQAYAYVEQIDGSDS